MVKLRKITESRDHIENLKTLLKFYSKNPDNWDKEWSVNPYYLVDLKKYGAGNCVCGHAIRYQFQFINTLTGKRFPVGSVCVHLLNLSKFNDTVDKLERVNQMANQELDTSLEPKSFVKQYKKFFNLENIEALSSYMNINIDPMSLSVYKDNYNKRSISDYVADKMKSVIEKLHKNSKEFINKVERESKPVTKAQVQNIIDTSSEDMLRFSQAKQGSLPF